MFTPKKTIGQLVAEAKHRIENVTVEQLEAELARGDIQLLDIRDVRERQKLGWIPGSLHVPRGMLEFWLDPTSPYYSGKVDPEKRIVLYCAGGGRSVLATDVLREMGFPHVANFETGFNSWKAAGLPIEGAPADAPKEAGPGWKSR
jgi:rhodanese-related sulfurtransferase